GGAGGGPVGGRGAPPDGAHGAYVLPLEGEVRGHGAFRGAAAEGAGGREPAAEEAGGAAGPGQPGAARAAGKRLTTVAARRAAVAEARARHAGLSERHACALVGCPLASQRYRSCRPEQAELRSRLHALAIERVRWGYRRLHLLLKREGRAVNVKRVYRLYREEGLAVRRRRRKRVAVPRAPQAVPTRLNEWGGVDFMSDALVGGGGGRGLNASGRAAREAARGGGASPLA